MVQSAPAHFRQLEVAHHGPGFGDGICDGSAGGEHHAVPGERPRLSLPKPLDVLSLEKHVPRAFGLIIRQPLDLAHAGGEGQVLVPVRFVDVDLVAPQVLEMQHALIGSRTHFRPQVLESDNQGFKFLLHRFLRPGLPAAPVVSTFIGVQIL